MDKPEILNLYKQMLLMRGAIYHRESVALAAVQQWRGYLAERSSSRQRLILALCHRISVGHRRGWDAVMFFAGVIH